MEKIKESIAKNKFRKAGLAVLEEIHMPDRQEQYDFFAKPTWEKDPLEKEEIVEETKKKDDKESEKEDKTDDKAPLILNMEQEWREMFYAKAKYIAHELEKEIERKKLFMPKASQVPFSKKVIQEGAKPRYLEDEGIYVGRKPYVTKKNMNLMENRLLNFPDNVNYFVI